MDFRNIEFGRADGKEEASQLPNLLINGYYDSHKLAESAIHKHTFLFLGYKGAGKTALSEHIRLTNQNYNHFVKNILLEDFPYKSFGKIIPGEAEAEAKLPVAWEWLLLLYVIESLKNDNSAEIEDGSNIENFLDALKKLGLLPISSIKDLVNKSSKTSFKVNISQIVEATNETNADFKETDLRFSHIISFLKKQIENIKTPNYHFLIIDGLDEILTSKEIQYQSIAALINQAKNLNIFFRENGLNFKILILCRTDIFERLPHPNKNKIRQDAAYTFDWYEDAESAKDSNLVQIANLRCSLVYPTITDVFEKFFPKAYEGNSIYNDLLVFTRHTPRDFLQLLKSIQKYCKSANVSIADISNGLKDYSVNYFLPEIKDELVGYTKYENIDIIFFLISALKKRDFLIREVSELATKMNKGTEINFEQIFSDLFECSAIGHVYKKDGGGETHYTFKFRNRNMTFNPNNRIILHKGLWKSLNLIN
jgi:hypothetical protein